MTIEGAAHDGIPFGLPPLTAEAAARIALWFRVDERPILNEASSRDDWYAAYLRSDVWQRTRELALEYYGNGCCLCNSGTKINVHHRTYERIGHERLADLIVLCRGCHARYHNKAA